jgi:hypothetical protein
MTPEDIKKFTIGCKETLGDLEETPTTIECDWEEARIKINKEKEGEISEVKLREILERRLKETRAGGERENIDKYIELAELRQEVLGDVLTEEGWIIRGKKQLREVL